MSFIYNNFDDKQVAANHEKKNPGTVKKTRRTFNSTVSKVLGTMSKSDNFKAGATKRRSVIFNNLGLLKKRDLIQIVNGIDIKKTILI